MQETGTKRATDSRSNEIVVERVVKGIWRPRFLYCNMYCFIWIFKRSKSCHEALEMGNWSYFKRIENVFTMILN